MGTAELGLARPRNAERARARIVNYNERTFYAGIVAALFGLIALLAPRRLAQEGAVRGARLPGPGDPAAPARPVAARSPTSRRSTSSRTSASTSPTRSGSAVLAAFGLQDLLDRPAGQRRNLVVPAVALTLGLLVAVSIGASGSELGHTFKHFVAGHDLRQRQGDRADQRRVDADLRRSASASRCCSPSGARAGATGSRSAVVLLAAADGLHFAKGYQPMGPAAEVIPPQDRRRSTTWSAARGRRPDQRRRLRRSGRGWGMVVRAQRHPRLRAAEPDQAHVVALAHRQRRPARLDAAGDAGPGARRRPGREHPRRALRPRRSGHDARRRHAPEPATSALQDRVLGQATATIIENPRAAPHVELPARIELAGDQDDAETRLAEPAFSPQNQVVIESDRPRRPGPRARAARAGACRDRQAGQREDDDRRDAGPDRVWSC